MNEGVMSPTTSDGQPAPQNNPPMPPPAAPPQDPNYDPYADVGEDQNQEQEQEEQQQNQPPQDDGSVNPDDVASLIDYQESINRPKLDPKITMKTDKAVQARDKVHLANTKALLERVKVLEERIKSDPNYSADTDDLGELKLKKPQDFSAESLFQETAQDKYQQVITDQYDETGKSWTSGGQSFLQYLMNHNDGKAYAEMPAEKIGQHYAALVDYMGRLKKPILLKGANTADTAWAFYQTLSQKYEGDIFRIAEKLATKQNFVPANGATPPVRTMEAAGASSTANAADTIDPASKLFASYEQEGTRDTGVAPPTSTQAFSPTANTRHGYYKEILKMLPSGKTR